MAKKVPNEWNYFVRRPGSRVRAVKMESVDAICYNWGVCRNVVQNWRKALKVPEINAGTMHLRQMVRTKLNQGARRRATLRADDPEAVVKSELPVHERAHPLVRPATSELMKERFDRTGKHPNAKLQLWTAKEEALLGTSSDEEVGRKLKRTEGAVRARRNQLGIRAFNFRYERPWTPEEEALLGLVPDRELARKLKRPFKGVQARREIRGLPPANPLRHRFTAAEDGLLGTVPDEEAAAKFGCSAESVKARRCRLGIPIFNSKIRHWTTEEDRLLGTMSDEHVAKRLARSVLSVRARRRQIGIPNRFSKVPTWSKDEDKQLGTLPDQEIAKVLKRNLPAVRHRRWFLGIPPSRPARNLRPRDSDS